MIYKRDDLNKVVCNIRIPIGTKEEIGTAVFIAKSEKLLYLITAAHVVNNINNNAYVILSDKTGIPTKVLLRDLLGGSLFIDHPHADLSKAEIIVTASNSKYFKGRFFPYDQIDISSNPLSKDTELTTIGFPLGLGATGAKFTPLTYRTFVAASVITLPRFDNKVLSDFIILELPSVGGYSGGPMFDLGYTISGTMTTRKKHTILHGIVHGTITDDTGGKLAAVTPCKYLESWL